MTLQEEVTSLPNCFGLTKPCFITSWVAVVVWGTGYSCQKKQKIRPLPIKRILKTNCVLKPPYIFVNKPLCTIHNSAHNDQEITLKFSTSKFQHNLLACFRENWEIDLQFFLVYVPQQAVIRENLPTFIKILFFFWQSVTSSDDDQYLVQLHIK